MSSGIHSLTVDTSFPPEIGDASAWYGPDLKRSTDWIARLSEADIKEVESAAHESAGELERSSVDLTSINTEDFPLPTLGPRLRRLMDEVISGRGFVLIKALPVERWTK